MVVSKKGHVLYLDDNELSGRFHCMFLIYAMLAQNVVAAVAWSYLSELVRHCVVLPSLVFLLLRRSASIHGLKLKATKLQRHATEAILVTSILRTQKSFAPRYEILKPFSRRGGLRPGLNDTPGTQGPGERRGCVHCMHLLPHPEENEQAHSRDTLATHQRTAAIEGW